MSSSLGRPFWTLWSSFASSSLGDGLNLVAYPLLAITLTDDARLVAVVSALRFLPFLVIGLPAGVVLDRFGRRRVVVVAQATRVLALGAAAIATASGIATIPLLAATGFVVGVGEVFTDGGVPAIVRDVVRSDRLEVANARLSAAETSANAIVGPLLGAVLFEVAEMAPFALSALLYAMAAGALIRLPAPESTPPSDDAEPLEPISFNASALTGGIRYVWTHPVLRPLAIAVAVFSSVGAGVDAVLVIVATEKLGLSGVGFAALMAVSAVTSIATSFVVSRLIASTSHGTSMQLSAISYAVGTALYGLAPTAPVAAAGAALEGTSAPMWNVVSATVRQRLVPEEVFGRMMTAYLFVAWSMQPVGALVAGAIAERWGADRVLWVAATMIALLLVGARPLFRRIDTEMRLMSASGHRSG